MPVRRQGGWFAHQLLLKIHGYQYVRNPIDILRFTDMNQDFQGGQGSTAGDISDADPFGIPASSIPKRSFTVESGAGESFFTDSPGSHEKTPCSIRPNNFST